MKKFTIRVNEDAPEQIAQELGSYGLEIYWVDRHSNDIFGVQGELTLEQVKKIPFIMSVTV